MEGERLLSSFTGSCRHYGAWWTRAARHAGKRTQQIMHAESALIVPPGGCLKEEFGGAREQPAAGHMLQRHCVVKLL